MSKLRVTINGRIFLIVTLLSLPIITFIVLHVNVLMAKSDK